MANETKYQYSGEILGSFEFVGTKAEYEKMIEDLRKDNPDYDGEIEIGSTRDSLPGQKHGQYRECLTYGGEAIAIAIGE